MRSSISREEAPADVPTLARRAQGGMNKRFWNRPRGPLLLGAAGCAACCVGPLAGLLLGAGAAAAAVAIFEPIARVLLAVAAVLAIAILVRRWRAARRAEPACAADGGACALDQRCGCGP